MIFGHGNCSICVLNLRKKHIYPESPPQADFSGKGEATFVGVATVNDVGKAGRRAMGLQEA